MVQFGGRSKSTRMAQRLLVALDLEEATAMRDNNW